MKKVKFTRDDARATFDKLAPQVNAQKFRDVISKRRLAISVGLNQCWFFWIEDGSFEEDLSTLIWMDVYARDFYREISPGIYQRRPIGDSVNYLYDRVSVDIYIKDKLDDLRKQKLKG